MNPMVSLAEEDTRDATSRRVPHFQQYCRLSGFPEVQFWQRTTSKNP
jgi:hypothetical protein